MEESLTCGKCSYSGEEVIDWLDLDHFRMSAGQFPIANWHVEIVDAVHLGEKGLIDEPLIGYAYLDYIESPGIELGLGEQDHDPLIVIKAERRVEHSLMRPSLDDAFACGHLDWQMDVGDSLGCLE